jgi:hypothetical protein
MYHAARLLSTCDCTAEGILGALLSPSEPDCLRLGRPSRSINPKGLTGRARYRSTRVTAPPVTSTRMAAVMSPQPNLSLD